MALQANSPTRTTSRCAACISSRSCGQRACGHCSGYQAVPTRRAGCAAPEPQASSSPRASSARRQERVPRRSTGMSSSTAAESSCARIPGASRSGKRGDSNPWYKSPQYGMAGRREFLFMAAGGLAIAGLPLSAAGVRAAAAAAAGPSARSVGAPSRADLAALFASPPESASPGAYWYWLGGQVTRAGITADLTAMRAAGISTPILYSIGKSGPDTLVHPPADALRPHWWELVEHAAAECERLGMILALNDCDGWATASGPWITPELSMQCVVWSQRTVSGPEPVAGPLPQPPAQHDYYRDIAALALPWRAEWEETSFSRHARITTDLPLEVAEPARITDPDNAEQVIDWQRVPGDRPSWIEYAFDRPFTLRSITVRTPSPPGFSPGVYRAANSLVVEASDDGKAFRRIGALEYPRHGWQTDFTTLTHALPQTTARYFRLVHHPIPSQPYEEEYDFGQDTRLRLFSIVLSSEPRIHQLAGKSGAQWAIGRRTTAADIPDDVCIQPADIIDLSGRLRPDGTLDWRPPPGRWRLL